MYLDAGLLKDLLQGSVSKDKLCRLAERQLTELMHAMKCKCAASQASEGTWYYQPHCTTTSCSIVQDMLIINSKCVNKSSK